VISFFREKNGNKVLPVINFSDKPVKVVLQAKYFTGSYTELFTGKEQSIQGEDAIELPAWGYKVFYGK
jgi:hypothetical protein